MKIKKMAALLVVLCIISCFVTPLVKAEENEITLRVNGINNDIELVQEDPNAITIIYEELNIEQGYIDKVEFYTIESVDEEAEETIVLNKDKEVIEEENEQTQIDKEITNIPTIIIPNNTGLVFSEPVIEYEIIE